MQVAACSALREQGIWTPRSSLDPLVSSCSRRTASFVCLTARQDSIIYSGEAETLITNYTLYTNTCIAIFKVDDKHNRRREEAMGKGLPPFLYLALQQ